LRDMLWPLFAWSSWTELPTEVPDTISEVAALASVRLVGVSSASHCGGGHYGGGRGAGLGSVGLRGLSQPLWWRARQLRALLWPVHSVGVGSASHGGVGDDR
jgi:hypothetical protein